MFQISTSGNDIQDSPFKKSILILIALMIFMSMITSGLCFGRIDQIFIGWRDMTASCDYYRWTCLGGTSYLDTSRDQGVMVLLALLLLSASLFFLFKMLLKLWNKCFSRPPTL